MVMRLVRLSVGGSGSSQHRRLHLATATTSATSTSTSSFPSSGRKRIGKLKTASNTILDSRDLAVSDSGDDEDFEEREEDDEDEDEGEDEEVEDPAASPSHLFPQQQHQRQQQHQQQQHSSRALRGSLLATQTLRAQRKSAQEMAASPTRFPLTGTFAFDSGSKEVAGGERGASPASPSSPSSSSSSLFLSAREVISAVSPFVSEERLRRIRDVARSRCFTVLPIVEGLFDRGNLGAVCRTVSFLDFFVSSGLGERPPSARRGGRGGWLRRNLVLLTVFFLFAFFEKKKLLTGRGHGRRRRVGLRHLLRPLQGDARPL